MWERRDGLGSEHEVKDQLTCRDAGRGRTRTLNVGRASGMLVAGAACSGFLESYAIQIILEAGCGCGAVQLASGLPCWALRCAAPLSDKHALPLAALQFVRRALFLCPQRGSGWVVWFRKVCAAPAAWRSLSMLACWPRAAPARNMANTTQRRNPTHSARLWHQLSGCTPTQLWAMASIAASTAASLRRLRRPRRAAS